MLGTNLTLLFYTISEKYSPYLFKLLGLHIVAVLALVVVSAMVSLARAVAFLTLCFLGTVTSIYSRKQIYSIFVAVVLVFQDRVPLRVSLAVLELALQTRLARILAGN